MKKVSSALNFKDKIMYRSEDLERFYFLYQTEVMPNGVSIEQFCSRNESRWFLSVEIENI